jgi:hypothetical protein
VIKSRKISHFGVGAQKSAKKCVSYYLNDPKCPSDFGILSLFQIQSYQLLADLKVITMTE